MALRTVLPPRRNWDVAGIRARRPLPQVRYCQLRLRLDFSPDMVQRPRILASAFNARACAIV